MMKTINKILALAACCLSVASCNDENLLTQERESWQGNDKISLSLTAAPETRAGDSRAVDVTVDEGTDGAENEFPDGGKESDNAGLFFRLALTRGDVLTH